MTVAPDQAHLPTLTTSGDDDHEPRQTPDRRQLACQQCRARKVKCDRRLSGCLRCARLDLVCSYRSGQAAVLGGNDDQVSPQELTQAGTKRRRIRRACTACRLMKAKCSGTQPCTRCRSLSQDCLYGGDSGPSAPVPLPEYIPKFGSPVTAQSHASVSVSIPAATSCNFSSEMTPGRAFELEKKEAVRDYIDAYFDKTDLAECQFLHRASILAEWSQGQLDTVLLKAICASGLQLIHFQTEEPVDKHVPQVWMKEVQQQLFTNLARTSISLLQTLLLLIQFRLASRFTEEVWILLSVAARIAFTKRLNYERPTADPVRQESLRRLMWTVFYLDKFFSGGIEDLTLCPTERMHIRLPSDDRCFQRGLKSRSQFLRDVPDKEADMDALAYRMKLFDLRDRILRYTRRVVLEKSSPFVSQEELRALDQELSVFEKSLPEEIGTDRSRLILICHSGEARTYVMLHSTMHLCRCDLYRFLIPGIRESVSQEAMETTPRQYTEFCQQQCLESALRLCDFWSQIKHLEIQRPIDSPTMAVAIYQVTKIVGLLFHLLPETGEHSLERLRCKLTEALSMTSYSKKACVRVRPCIADIERLIPTLGLQSQSSGTLSPQGTPGQTRLHRRSKHAFAPDDEEQTDPAVDEQSPVSQAWTGTPIQTFGESHLVGARSAWNDSGSDERQHVEDAYFSDYNPLHHHALPYEPVAIGSTDLEHTDISFPLHPFDMQLNAYSDASVHSIFPPTE